MDSQELDRFKRAGIKKVSDLISKVEESLEQALLEAWGEKKIKLKHRWVANTDPEVIEEDLDGVRVVYLGDGRIEVNFYAVAKNPITGKFESVSTKEPIFD